MKLQIAAWLVLVAGAGPALAQDAVPGARIEIVSGAGQKGKIEVHENYMFPTAVFTPLTVRIVDRAGRPIPNATVQWKCIAAPAQRCLLTQGADNAATSTTDNDGLTTLAQTFGHSAAAMFQKGDVEIRASYGAASVSFVFPVEEHITQR